MSNCAVCAALVASVALVGCGGSATPAPAPVPSAAPQPQPAASPEPKNEALARADALVADLKKREAALQDSGSGDKADTGGAAAVPVVVEVSPPGTASGPTRNTGPTTPPLPAPAGRRRNSADVITSSYTLAEKNRTLWRFSWTMSVRNQERTPIRVRAEMHFRDIKGALLGSAGETIDIAGSTVAEVRGVVVMKAGDAVLVARATPRIALLKSPDY